MKPRNPPGLQPLSNAGDAENAQGGLTRPFCRTAVLITRFFPRVLPWLGFRGSTLSSVYFWGLDLLSVLGWQFPLLPLMP